MTRQIILAAALLSTAHAFADKGHIEYATLLNSSSFAGLHSFGFYSPLSSTISIQGYGLAELSWYRLENIEEYDFVFRIGAGLTTGQSLAPFIEVGTSLFDLLLVDEEEERVCETGESDCDIDVDVKVGLRYSITTTILTSIYHQRIHFGDFHDTLTGNHNLTGISIGYRF